ncbi:DNA polymerase III subunit beta [Aromatoleum aromaticum]|uniref:Beta sliding clamp n=1 Tax=Aromatoleum aromaticum (strain DSM 19018 / LMG 30748 / EbN1) TaxID=76114 RepID=Q5P4N9_AROAE|nr:DNA polymerase III subunit beta [Aromatoleum aromaticum]NMG56679.1 DNA polymerase III subunit beta [Aromatoleum aromaticum]CAI07723.1 DNA polymerase III (Beta chain) [Aromatoleum aromaticum EbN1]
MLLLTTTRDALLAPLQSVAGIVEKRHTLPILSNVLIEKHGDQLTLLATDIEIQIRTTTAGHIGGEDASITVAARKLQDILRAVPEGDVTVMLDDKRLTVKAGRSRFALQTLPAADYPRMNPPDGDATHFSVSQKSFKRQLAQVAYAMAQQDIRYYLNGLLLIASGSELRMVATDGHRLAFASNPLAGDVPHTEVILPRKTVMELARQLADSEDPLEVILAGNQVVFRFGPIELVSKLIDGKFPDYERVIPQNHPKLLTFERMPLLATLSRVAILTNEKFRGVRLVLGDGSLKIVSTNAEQEEALEELEVDYHDDPLDIGFNVTYLLDVLNNVTSDTIEWRFNDGNSSALVTLPGNATFKYVVMPMRI